MFENFIIDERNIEHLNKKLVLVIYDIVDNKRRLKFVKLMEQYGIRVQKSAFEMIIDIKQYSELINKIPYHIDDEDNVRVYKLRLSGEVVSWGSGMTEPEEVIII
ncbi:MAG: CRISPR-associated endonuclease Cas2 [Clostridia bacterium]|nr:CRISPR-associated endonuclease Cas2 [Clostridia bacterium]